MELSLPYGDSLKHFRPCEYTNPVDVIIKNSTDSIVHFYENRNRLGYYNFHFQIETQDSLYIIEKTRATWTRGFPLYHSINPGESLVFHFDLLSSTCPNHKEETEGFGATRKWEGLPIEEYKNATIRAVYEIPEEQKFIINNGFRVLNDGNELKDSTQNDTIFIYPEKLISNPINIQIFM